MHSKFNPHAIQYPWVATAASTRLSTFDFADVTWLWRYEDGPLDWQKVMDSAAQNDIVITAPQYVGEVKYKEDQDNRYNSEFASRLSLDPRFRGPIRFQAGRFEPVEVAVFLRQTLGCRLGQNGFATE